jgi:hypothetical protein
MPVQRIIRTHRKIKNEKEKQMKTKEINTRLSLNKQTIANLDLAMMAEVVGGTGPTPGTNESVVDCAPKKPSSPCQ